MVAVGVLEEDSGEWMEEGRRVSGTEPPIVSSSLPLWLQPQLIKEGQQFVRRHFFSVIFAHLISLLFLLCYAPVAQVLLRTGRSHSSHNSKIRYFSTVVHVKKWYEGDLLDPTDPTHKDIHKICKIHHGVALTLQNNSRKACCDYALEDKHQQLRDALCHDLGADVVTENNTNTRTKMGGEGGQRLSISQLDMAVTQFCFAGFVPLFWRELGVCQGEERGIQGFLHMWALIGHRLGIQDHFNIALQGNERWREEVWTQLLLPQFRTCSSNTVQLWVWLVEGLNQIIYFLTLKSLLMFITTRLLKKRSNKSKLWEVMSWWDRVCLQLMKWCFSSWLGPKTTPTCLIRNFFNALVRFALWLFDRKQRLNFYL